MTLDLGTVNDRLTILNEYIGKPYLVNGRGPDAFDCFGLVLDIYRRLFDIHLPDWTVEDATLATAVRVINKAWRSQEANDLAYKVDAPEDFDIAFLYRKDIAHHVGIYVNGGVMHASHKNSGVAWERPEVFSSVGRGSLQYWRLK
jgi:cell wall-associated NlpC family hydrolase